MVTVAVVSFPGNNCEVESLRALKRAGMHPLLFRWNDDPEKLDDVDGYFLPGGFSYEDRGRAGMVAARDPLLDRIGREAEQGKPVIGNCNGAQILIESGIVPLGKELRMSLAPNVVNKQSTGFLNEWIWITPACEPDRCATANWSGAMHMPMAHGEGRFTTKDPDLLRELENNNQLAFRYCTANGDISDEPAVTPNGSPGAVAGICNPAGNAVALMPHPERTTNGDPYFVSLRQWIEQRKQYASPQVPDGETVTFALEQAPSAPVEIFIQTIITNNEERTVEQAARHVVPNLSLTQMRYLAPSSGAAEEVLQTISLFNPNKERAYVRKNGETYRWNADKKHLETAESPLRNGTTFLRVDEPDTGATAIGGGTTGLCYVCRNCRYEDVTRPKALEVLANPHASSLTLLQKQ